MRSAHVVMKDGIFVCNHCGSIYRPDLPAPINVFLKMSQAFVADHKRCPKPEPKP